jgi:hypothetical protein
VDGDDGIRDQLGVTHVGIKEIVAMATFNSDWDKHIRHQEKKERRWTTMVAFGLSWD